MKYSITFSNGSKKEFNDLPNNIYVCEGFQDISDKGKIMWFGLDSDGCTALIPILDSNNNFIFQS